MTQEDQADFSLHCPPNLICTFLQIFKFLVSIKNKKSRQNQICVREKKLGRNFSTGGTFTEKRPLLHFAQT